MKCRSIWMAAAVAVFGAYGQTSQTTVVHVSSQVRQRIRKEQR